MTTPLSIRFNPVVLEKLRRHAAALPGATPSGLAQRLVDEGLRELEHPEITFRDGPTGRRAGLRRGLDVWEVITTLRNLDERGEAAVEAAAEVLTLAPQLIEAALRYYTAYPREIDDRIAASDAAAEASVREWEARQRLLA